MDQASAEVTQKCRFSEETSLNTPGSILQAVSAASSVSGSCANMAGCKYANMAGCAILWQWPGELGPDREGGVTSDASDQDQGWGRGQCTAAASDCNVRAGAATSPRSTVPLASQILLTQPGSATLYALTLCFL